MIECHCLLHNCVKLPPSQVDRALNELEVCHIKISIDSVIMGLCLLLTFAYFVFMYNMLSRIRKWSKWVK